VTARSACSSLSFSVSLSHSAFNVIRFFLYWSICCCVSMRTPIGQERAHTAFLPKKPLLTAKPNLQAFQPRLFLMLNVPLCSNPWTQKQPARLTHFFSMRVYAVSAAALYSSIAVARRFATPGARAPGPSAIPRGRRIRLRVPRGGARPLSHPHFSCRKGKYRLTDPPCPKTPPPAPWKCGSRYDTSDVGSPAVRGKGPVRLSTGETKKYKQKN